VLVLDAAGEIGGLVVSAPTQWNFEALFHGTASHAGVSPEKGVSALAMAAEAICAMRLGRVDALSTANIGVVSGGVDTNVVAPEARVTGECRSQDPERVEELKSAMEDAMRSAAANHGGTVDVTWSLQYRGYSVSQDDEIYTLVASACGDVGVEAVPYTTGGGADSNVLAQAGVPVLALACAMRDVHSSSEHLRIDDLETLTALVEAVIGRATEED
jgi:tripeptide aminopeptidase